MTCRFREQAATRTPEPCWSALSTRRWSEREKGVKTAVFRWQAAIGFPVNLRGASGGPDLLLRDLGFY